MKDSVDIQYPMEELIIIMVYIYTVHCTIPAGQGYLDPPC